MRYAIVTKIFHFESAHHLPGHRGKCAHLHGHSYRLEVTIRGPIKDAPGESDHGMVMDFDDLSRTVKNSVIERLDHRDLNEVTGLQTTAENLARMVGEWIAPSAANPEPGVRITPHPAPLCTVSFDRDTFSL